MLTKLKKHIAIILSCLFIINLVITMPTEVKADFNNLKIYATNAIGAKIIRLDWQGSYASGSKFRIQQRKDSGSYVDITHYLDSTINQYTHVLMNYSSESLYSYRVAVYNSSNVFLGYTNEVYLSVDGIVKPENINAAAVSSTMISISWEYPDYKNAKTIIERKTQSDTDWQAIATLDEGIKQYTDAGLSPNTYYSYRISSVLGQNLYSEYITAVPVLTFLNEPSNINASFSAPGEVNLSWSDNWADIVYIDIEKKSASGDFTLVKTVTNQLQTSWIDENTVANNTYTYRIKARTPSNSNSSVYSEEKSVTCIILNTPDNLKASAVSYSEIQLNWTDSSLSSLGYELWRKAGESGSWVKYTELPADVRSFTDKGVLSNTIYYYRLRSYLTYSNVFSEYSNSTWAKTSLLDVSMWLDYSITSSKYVNLEWKLENNNENVFNILIERLSESDTDWKLLATLGKDVTSYVDYGAQQYKKYYYRIKIVNLTNNSVRYSTEVTVIPGLPNSPSELKLTNLSINSIRLDWRDNSFNEGSFIIERKLPSYGDYFEVDRLDANTKSYTEYDLVPDMLYYYRIKAVNKSGESAYSNEVYTLSHKPVTFDDLKNHSWAKEAIENLSSRGVINGKTDTLFCPNDMITRAEFVSLVIRSFKLSRTPVGYLADVLPNDWYYKDIMTAKSMGIISADGGYFNPGSPITREDMAVIIYKTLQGIEKPLPPTDVKILDGYMDKDMVTAYALPYMASLKGEKIIDGRSSTILAPKDTATRAEAAVIIYRIIDR